MQGDAGYAINKDKENREINIFAVLRNILKKWQILLLSGLLIAVIYGLYGVNEAKKSNLAYSEAMDAYLAQLETYNATKANLEASIAKYKVAQTNAQNNYNNSIYAVLNPNKISRYTITYGVKTEKEYADMSADEKAVYTDILSSYILAANNSSYAVTINSVEYDVAGVLVSITCDNEAGEIYIVAKGDIQDNAEKLANIAKSSLEANHDSASSIGEHTLELLRSGITTVYDSDIANTINSLKAAPEAYNAQIEAINTQIAALAVPVVPEVTETSIKSALLKKGIIGFVIGVMIAGVIIAILYISRGYIGSADDFSGTYRLRILARIQKKNFNGDLKVVISQLNHYGKNKKIAIISTLDEAVVGRQANFIASSLSDDVSVCKGYGFLTNSDVLDQLPDVDGIVFFEKIDESRFSNIERSLSILDGYEKKCIGVVLI